MSVFDVFYVFVYGYCTGDLSCYDSLYTSSDEDALYYVCSGYQSCSNSQFTNIEYILSLGFMSLEDSYLENVKNIDAYNLSIFELCMCIFTINVSQVSILYIIT